MCTMFGAKTLIWIIVSLYLLSLLKDAESSLGEDRLMKDIFTKNEYNALSRPVHEHKESLNVQMEIVISQIVGVDEMNENILLSMWKHLRWVDYRLSWNATDYDGVESIRLPKNQIWTPDIVLYNRLEEETSREQDSLIIVSHTGLCLYMPFGVYSAQCTIDIRWFPFDDQICPLDYESWTYDLQHMNLTSVKDSADLSWYKNSTEWNLIDASCARVEKKYDCCEEKFSVLRFTLHIRRKTLYYVFNLILPCALISVLTALAFLLPTESGERVSLCITGLLALSVYQIIVIENIPASSDSVPLIGLYFSSLIILNIVGIIMTIASVSLHHRSSRFYRMSPWVRTCICVRLATLLRVSKPHLQQRSRSASMSGEGHEDDNSVKAVAGCIACPLIANQCSWNEVSGCGRPIKTSTICCCAPRCASISRRLNRNKNIDQSESTLHNMRPCTSNDSVCIVTAPSCEEITDEPVNIDSFRPATNNFNWSNTDEKNCETSDCVQEADDTNLNKETVSERMLGSREDCTDVVITSAISHRACESSGISRICKSSPSSPAPTPLSAKPKNCNRLDIQCSCRGNPSMMSIQNNSAYERKRSSVDGKYSEMEGMRCGGEKLRNMEKLVELLERVVERKEGEGMDDWKFAGLVIDRACFWLIAIFQLGTSLTIFTLAIISEMKF